MSKKVLFVDDEPNVLQSIRRSLRKQFPVVTAEGGDEAIAMLDNGDEYAVIISDMRMPGMNGVELLSRVKKRWPDTVRMMLTGNADQATAVAAVNHGDIFRFLNKPCEPVTLAQAVKDGLRQHQLITAERELLEKTLRGSIKALAEVMSLTNPEVFGHTVRLKRLMSRLVKAMKLPDMWQYESVALLSQMGCVTIPQDLVTRKIHGHPLPPDELEEFAAHTKVGAELIGAIPRMDVIADSIRYQEKHFDGTGYPAGGPSGEDIPLGARLMKVVLDFDALESSGATGAEALGQLKAHRPYYDPEVLKALGMLLEHASFGPPVMKAVLDLTDKMIIAEDIRTTSNVLLVAKGQDATISVRRHLQSFLDNKLIGSEVLVYLGSAT